MSRHRDSPHPRNLYVASLPSTFTSEQLGELFKPFGTVLSVRMKPKAPGCEPHLIGRCGFVLFKEAAEATRALAAMSGKSVEGMQIEVRRAWMTPQLNPAARNVAAFHVPRTDASVVTSNNSPSHGSITEMTNDRLLGGCDLAGFESPAPSWTLSCNSLSASESTVATSSATHRASTSSATSLAQSPSSSTLVLPMQPQLRGATRGSADGNPLRPNKGDSPKRTAATRQPSTDVKEPLFTHGMSSHHPPPTVSSAVFASYSSPATSGPTAFVTDGGQRLLIVASVPSHGTNIHSPHAMYCYPTPQVATPFVPPQPFAVAPFMQPQSIVPMLPPGVTFIPQPMPIPMASPPTAAPMYSWGPRYIF